MNALVRAVNGPGPQCGGVGAAGGHWELPPDPGHDQGPRLHFRPPRWRSMAPAGMVATAEVSAFPLDGASDWSRAGIESAGPGMRLSWQLPEVIKGSARLRSGPFFIPPLPLPAGRPFSPAGHGRPTTYRAPAQQRRCVLEYVGALVHNQARRWVPPTNGTPAFLELWPETNSIDASSPQGASAVTVSYITSGGRA